MAALTDRGDDDEETSCPDLPCEQVHAYSQLNDGGPHLMNLPQSGGDAIDVGAHKRHGSRLLGGAGFYFQGLVEYERYETSSDRGDKTKGVVLVVASRKLVAVLANARAPAGPIYGRQSYRNANIFQSRGSDKTAHHSRAAVVVRLADEMNYPVD